MGPVAARRSQRIRRLGWDHVMSCESHVTGPDGEEREETGVDGDMGSAVRLASFLKRASQVGHVTML